MLPKGVHVTGRDEGMEALRIEAEAQAGGGGVFVINHLQVDIVESLLAHQQWSARYNTYIDGPAKKNGCSIRVGL